VDVPAAIAAIDDGDRAWFAGDRRTGVREWRSALDLADDSPAGHAAEVMARIRLLRAGSTLSPLWQGPKLEKAATACWTGTAWDGPWCTLAAADYDLLAPPGVGDRDRGLAAARSVADVLPERAASREAWVSGDTTALAAMDPRDGLGDALVHGRVSEPGPTVIGVGVLAGPASGLGLGVHLVDRDVLRQRHLLAVDAWVAQRGFGGALTVSTAGTVGAALHASGAREPWFDGDAWRLVDSARIAPGVVVRPPKTTVEAGPLARWDADPGEKLAAGHGAWASAHVRPLPALRLDAFGEVAVPMVADYARHGGIGEVTVQEPAWDGAIATRLRGEAATVGPDIPEVRTPTVGGADVLRGARAGELRGPWTLAADLELREPLRGPLWGAWFVDGAVVDGAGAHGGGGVGLRWVQGGADGTIRLDAAVTDVGWGIYVGWGEVVGW
jgi:hypothetical protein